MECQECCIACEKYSTVKEQKAKCETRKERGRAVRRAIYKTKKNKK